MKETVKRKFTESSEPLAGETLVMNLSCTGSDCEPRSKTMKRHLTGRLKRLLHRKRIRTSSKNSVANNPHLSSMCVVDLNSLSVGKCDSLVDTTMPSLIQRPACKPLYTHNDYISMDCEFVGVGPRKISALGRCSIVNFSGDIICDIYARPAERITDYRTPWSGIRKEDLAHASPFEQVRCQIQNILKGKVVVGHALHNDFRVLGIRHPSHMVCDTAKYKPLRSLAQLHDKNVTSLKTLTFLLLGYPIQQGEHCSVEDSRACMQLFRLVRAKWEATCTAQYSSNSAETDDENYNSFLNDTYWPEDISN